MNTNVEFLVKGLFLCVYIFGAACHESPAESSDKRPNFLLIVTDDQAPHTLSDYGNTVCQTPNLDRLAREGIVLDGAHHMGSWSGAVCLPSRTMIQTSVSLWRTEDIPNVKRRMQPNTYVHQPKKWMAELTEDDLDYNCMPAIFNRAGYDTFRTCKIGNTYEAANRLYTGRSDGAPGIERVNTSDWHRQQVMEFLRQLESSETRNPFLIFFGFTLPHDSRDGKPELLSKYGAVNENIPAAPDPNSPPLQANYLPSHPFHHGHPGLRDEERVPGVMLRRDEATIRNELGREYACIENIDTQIGMVLDKLEAMGELDNTYIMFTSDHGIAVGRHGLAGKQNLYEHTWRVPFLVMGPGIQSRSRALGNIYLMDILPTLCDLAGIEQAESMDGRSFKPVLMGEEESIRDVMYGAYCGGTKPGMRSVKKGDWKLIKYDVLDGQVRETQLLNEKENPHEFIDAHRVPTVIALTGVTPQPNQRNLAYVPEYAQKRKEMEALLLEEMIKWEDPYRLWDQPQLGN